MRRMGIDFGHKNVGIAFTDEGGMMAFPHGVVKNDKDLLKKVTALAEEKGVKEIVIGHSVNRKGGNNKIHSQVEEFIGDLTLQLGVPIHLEPEYYTTQQALLYQGRTSQTDAAAASIILDSFLMKQK